MRKLLMALGLILVGIRSAAARAFSSESKMAIDRPLSPSRVQ
jgi:hypothetical protein